MQKTRLFRSSALALSGVLWHRAGSSESSALALSGVLCSFSTHSLRKGPTSALRDEWHGKGVIAKARVLALLHEWSQRVFKGSLAGLKQPWVRPGPGPAWARGRDPNGTPPSPGKVAFLRVLHIFSYMLGFWGGAVPLGARLGPRLCRDGSNMVPHAPRRPQLGNPTKRLPHRGPTTSNRTFQRSTNTTSLYIHIYN